MSCPSDLKHRRELRQLQAFALLDCLMKGLSPVGIVDFQRLIRVDVWIATQVVIGDLLARQRTF